MIVNWRWKINIQLVNLLFTDFIIYSTGCYKYGKLLPKIIFFNYYVLN